MSGLVAERGLIHGHVVWELFDALGRLKDRGESDNLVTQVGDQLYGERGAGITTLAVATGMKLGTGSTAVAKTGAGAGIVTYLSNSHQALDATYPQSALNGSSRRITYRCTFAAGKATTASTITEAVLVNETLTDAAGAGASATISRVLLSPTIGGKGASDSLVVTWTHDLLGA